MKKIYLLILLAVSMCFATFTAGHSYEVGFSYEGIRLSLHNGTNHNVSGFKIYFYLNAPPATDLNTVIRRYILPQTQYGTGTEVYDYSLIPTTIRVDTLSAIQYRVVLEYRNTQIPVNGYFPTSTNSMLRIRVNTSDENGIQGWGSYGHTIRGYVIESLSGEILYGSHPSVDPLRRIGVLTNETTCSDVPHTGASTPLTIKIDVENSGNQTKIIQGTDYHPLGVTIPGNYIEFKFCTLEYDQLPRVPYDYIVLKLDSECPSNSYPLSRYHDAEDNNNISAYTGYIWPNIVYSSGDVKLNFCFVPKKSNATRKYPFDKKYGIFAYKTGTNISMSHIFIDDENTGNINNWDIPSVTSSYTSRIHTIMYGTDHTNYFVIKWTGTNNQMLSKSAEVEVAESPISAGQPLVAAAPFAPAIKGLNRSAVSVELKSEGKVKVSIVNANGSVIANVAQESLQPGVHQIKWNSGMVPSGRYIVKVEQNGMVNARNVILK